jgi:hypothetical protein
MSASEFELVLECIREHPGATGKEIASRLRSKGHTQFTSRLANQVLYRLLAAELVDRDGSSDKPRWFEGKTWTAGTATNSTSPTKRPLREDTSGVREYLIASTKVKVLLDDEASPNDPYVHPDWVGSHVIASINIKHPFWILRLTNSSENALYSMFVAIDAYVQWKAAQLHEPPDATEIQRMRDFAFRHCTLLSSEIPNSDQMFDA